MKILLLSALVASTSFAAKKDNLFFRTIASGDTIQSNCEVAYQESSKKALENIGKTYDLDTGDLAPFNDTSHGDFKRSLLGLGFFAGTGGAWILAIETGIAVGAPMMIPFIVVGTFVTPIVAGAIMQTSAQQKIAYQELVGDLKVAEGHGNKFFAKIANKAYRKHGIGQDQLFEFIEKGIQSGYLCAEGNKPLDAKQFRKKIFDALDMNSESTEDVLF